MGETFIAVARQRTTSVVVVVPEGFVFVVILVVSAERGGMGYKGKPLG